MQVTPQRINTILRGDENLTLETIVKLEKALQIEIIEVVKATEMPLVAKDNKMITRNKKKLFSYENEK